MEATKTTWPDSRLDDLNDRVKIMDKRIDDGFARIDARIDGTNERIDKLNHTMITGLVALISIIAVLLTAFLTIVVTHL